MAKRARIEVKEKALISSLQEFLKRLLKEGGVDAVLVAEHIPLKGAVMPALVTDPERLDAAAPLAPSFPVNAARLVSKLTRKPLDERIAVVLRPCEIRAFVELVKLKQGDRAGVIIVGIDCLGAYSNLDYARFAGSDGLESTECFSRSVLEGRGAEIEGVDLAAACKVCEHPVPQNADLAVGLFGVDMDESFLLEAHTEVGEKILSQLGLASADVPPERERAVEELITERIARRDQMFSETSAATDNLSRLSEYLSRCVNCGNCREACPVCYCRECVFKTDVFDHEPSQYLRWGKKKGLVRMPTDTVFYHLTRLAHMSTACVGCGQCSNACPNNIPVMELFRTIAHSTQRAFDYEAGRSLEEEPPLSTFQEREYPEVTGGKC